MDTSDTPLNPPLLSGVQEGIKLVRLIAAHLWLYGFSHVAPHKNVQIYIVEVGRELCLPAQTYNLISFSFKSIRLLSSRATVIKKLVQLASTSSV